MTNIKIALRWFAALVAAILVYLSIWAAVASVWVNFGGNAVSAYKISLLLSSVAGIFVGSFIVPRHQWKAAFGALAALALFGPTWLFAKAAMAEVLNLLNFLDIGFTFLGLFIAYQAIRAGMAGRKIRRAP